MSTPQTLSQASPHHYNLDYRQRPLLNVNDRQLPPPRPSSNLSHGYYTNLPPRSSSNMSNRQYPPRSESGAAGAASTYTQHSQAREGAQYPHTNGLSSHSSYEDLGRTASRASQHQMPAQPAQSPATAGASQTHDTKPSRRGDKPVDWMAFFNGKVPDEIITIHDDDSPAPQVEVNKLPPPTTGGSTAQHVDKRRRVDEVNGQAPVHDQRPYSFSDTTSSDSLNTTTAATSLASSNSSRLEGPQVGQKRKRSARLYDSEPKVDHSRSRPRGYLACYGNYAPPSRPQKKQGTVHVPSILEVHLMHLW